MRTVSLKGELRMVKLGDLTVDAYSFKIKSISTILTSRGSPMSNDDIVTYALQGLNEKFAHVAGIITHREHFSDLTTVRLMITMEGMRLKAKSQASVGDSSSGMEPGLNMIQKDFKDPWFCPSYPTLLLAESTNNTRRENGRENRSTSQRSYESQSTGFFPFVISYWAGPIYSTPTVHGPTTSHKDYRSETAAHGSVNSPMTTGQGTDTAYLLLSVDDIVLTASFEVLLVLCNPCRKPIDTESKLGDNVQQVCLDMHDPKEPHFLAVKRILFYGHDILDHGLQLYSSSITSLVANSNADWAGCPTIRRSTSSYCMFLSNNLFSSSSKRQLTLSLSRIEAKFHGVANAVAETCWLRNLLCELHTPLSSANLANCDNVSILYLSSNTVQHQRTKHIMIDIHSVRDLVVVG
uniref:Ribonuclease H-like domain-containing protein n=1 Tax=Tanacetum cinerariifolium TaxID=118510 RepID=A0A699GSZ3_TANCI|nr:ribonuclease H-like domain-containing protein [Tanacetum cinerariifolium]